MVRTVKSRHEEEEEDDEEFVSRASYGSSDKAKLDGETSDQKVNTLRSKHSETEQRRRSKINERFQILRDLIPQNDQKRDKASFLLEVIEYIQFLHDKLHVYEGSYQGWSQEPSKLMPWRNNCGSMESLIGRSQLLKNRSGHEDNIVISPAMLSNAQNSFESDLSAASAYKATDQSPTMVSQTIPVNLPLQPNVYGEVPVQPHEGSVSDADHLTTQSQTHFWQSRPCPTESAVPSYTLNEQVEQKIESGEPSISDAYSQGLLNTLTHAMQSSGVDLSQASISVQLDIGKRRYSGLNATIFNAKDHQHSSSGEHAMAHYGVGIRAGESDTVHKRLRREQS